MSIGLLVWAVYDKVSVRGSVLSHKALACSMRNSPSKDLAKRLQLEAAEILESFKASCARFPNGFVPQASLQAIVSSVFLDLG